MNTSGTPGAGNLEAEVVVIGGGGGGLAAAVAAAEMGVGKIIVLEKRGAVGGNTALSVGPFAADSPAQKRTAIEFQRDELFKIAMHWAHWKINPRIVRAFIDKSGDTIRWLEEKGLRFRCMALYPNQFPPVWHLPEGGSGSDIIKVLSGECKKLGVEIFTSAPAKKILTGPDGRITEVLGEKKGKPFRIVTKSVIIASGGYGGNKKLLKKYCPNYRDNMKCDGLPHTGDGLLMAMEIGAATEGLGLLLLSGPQIPQAAALHLGTNPDNAMIAPLMAVALEPDTLWLNKRGKRYVDESTTYHHFMSSNAVNMQPDNLTFTILDHDLVEMKTKEGLLIGLGRSGHEEQRSGMPGLERELHRQADKDWLKIADTWDEIADWMGADPDVLQASVDEYNDACDKGHDPLFAKGRVHLVPLRTPPYYAIKGNSDFLDTLGGIKINEHMEVLDKQDNPIPGLFAAGVVAGGWQADTYCDVLSGAASGFGFNSGRIAGENAATFLTATNSRS
jgi:fumarate reductase flavoprotein subunit